MLQMMDIMDGDSTSSCTLDPAARPTSLQKTLPRTFPKRLDFMRRFFYDGAIKKTLIYFAKHYP
jgi:hypothetical protein